MRKWQNGATVRCPNDNRPAVVHGHNFEREKNNGGINNNSWLPSLCLPPQCDVGREIINMPLRALLECPGLALFSLFSARERERERRATPYSRSLLCVAVYTVQTVTTMMMLIETRGVYFLYARSCSKGWQNGSKLKGARVKGQHY